MYGVETVLQKILGENSNIAGWSQREKQGGIYLRKLRKTLPKIR